MSTPAEIAAGAAVEAILVLSLILFPFALLYRIWGWFFPVPKRQMVQAFERGVVLRDGKVEKVLGSGAYWITPKRKLIVCDVRPTPFQVAGQELITADGMGIRISLAGEYRVTNPASFVTESSDAFTTFYLELRQDLRLAAGEMSSQDVFGDQGQLIARVKELLLPRQVQLGVEMTQLDVYEAVPVGWLREA